MERRGFVALAAAGGVSTAAGANPVLRTSLCGLLGIDYPILQAGMSGVAGPDLCAAVSAAGGLGILTATLIPPDQLRARIRRIRELTKRPFGVNLVFQGFRQPANPAGISEETLKAVHGLLNRFRRALDVPESQARPPAVPETLPATVDLLVEERIPVFSVGLGNPEPELVARFHAYGGKLIAMAATVEDCMALERSGVDVIVAQGSDAGGHRSTFVKAAFAERASIGTLSLVPQVVARVTKPVIAAGGITNGRGIAAALALGASGVLVGTRFIAARESEAPESYRKAVVESSSDSTSVTDIFTGMYARVLRNRITEEYSSSGAPVLPPVLQALAALDISRAAAAKNSGDYLALYAGQGVGSFRGGLGAAEIVRSLVEETRAALAAMKDRVQTA